MKSDTGAEPSEVKKNQEQIKANIHNLEGEAKDSVLSFKVVNEQMRINKQTIQYNSIVNKICQEVNTPSKIFEFSQELRQLEQLNNDFSLIEKTILSKYTTINQEIKAKKAQMEVNYNKIYSQQLELQTLAGEIKNLTELISSENQRFDQTYSQILQRSRSKVLNQN